MIKLNDFKALKLEAYNMIKLNDFEALKLEVYKMIKLDVISTCIQLNLKL